MSEFIKCRESAGGRLLFVNLAWVSHAIYDEEKQFLQVIYKGHNSDRHSTAQLTGAEAKQVVVTKLIGRQTE